MKFLTKLSVAALLMCAVSVQAAKVLKNWAPTTGYNKSDAAAWQDDGKTVTLKGIDRGKWIIFRTSPPVPAQLGQKLQITLKNVKAKGEIKLGYYAYVSGFGCCAQKDEVLKPVTAPSVTVEVPVEGKSTKILRPRITIMPGAELSFSGIEFKVVGQAEPKYTAVALPDKPDALYKVGETVKFTVKALKDGKDLKGGNATVYIYKNGIYTGKHSLDLSKSSIVEEKMNVPGFVVATADIVYNGKKIVSNVWGAQIGAAGFSVDQIKAGKPAPADLLDYWHGEFAKLNKEIPANFQKKLVNANGNHNRYQLICDNFGGTKTYATIIVPKKPGKYPMIFTVPPAGNAVFSYPTDFSNAIRVTIAVFDRTFPSQEAYNKFNSPTWYFYMGAQKRNTYYYYKSILGMMRVMDYAMKEIPEWDGKHLAAIGRSQGGGSAIIMSALNQKIQCVSADVPALCDHNARTAGRRPGWPQVMDYPKTAKTFAVDAQYFDAANFAAFVKCPAVVSVGFYDTMCEPASVYAAFNNLKGEKKIINCITYGHGWGNRDNTFDKETEKLVNTTFAK
ncbi:MAG: acetylxylan esterase [Lentisphaerae bacterium]|nr:acetylxylan esterase [Lentisphaerota bacterium]